MSTHPLFVVALYRAECIDENAEPTDLGREVARILEERAGGAK